MKGTASRLTLASRHAIVLCFLFCYGGGAILVVHSWIPRLPLSKHSISATSDLHHGILCCDESLWRGLLPLQKNVGYQLCMLTVENESLETTTVRDYSVGESSLESRIGTMAFLIPSQNADEIPSKFGASSPVRDTPPSLFEAAQHIAQKIYWWSDATIHVSVIVIPSPTVGDSVFPALCEVDLVLAMGLADPIDLEYASALFAARRSNRSRQQKFRQAQLAVDCSLDNPAGQLPATVGPFDAATPSVISQLFPWTAVASGRRLLDQMNSLFKRHTSDDYALAVLLFFNRFSGSTVAWVRHTVDATWEKGPIRNAKEFAAMIDKCGDCVLKCVGDDSCRECLNTLTALDTRDQVASYRTIVSFESTLLRDFSFCILQKNNIFNCAATIPQLPRVQPAATWRGGQRISEADGRRILVGHLDDPSAFPVGKSLPTSWIVACGANVAYDQFPSQNQVFYPASGKTSADDSRDMWYDPVFRVTTLDGRNIWAKRHYKVRPGGGEPCTFRFSVLDNGVTSNEFWTIVGVADDLSWVVFHYAGAASAVGQRYIGGLLCTPDGMLPSKSELDKTIWPLFRSAGIQPWDLYVVDNSKASPGYVAAGPPPLDFFRHSQPSPR
jgi:VDE lipocalin domain